LWKRKKKNPCPIHQVEYGEFKKLKMATLRPKKGKNPPK
jgi:hypothetical protein